MLLHPQAGQKTSLLGFDLSVSIALDKDAMNMVAVIGCLVGSLVTAASSCTHPARNFGGATATPSRGGTGTGTRMKHTHQRLNAGSGEFFFFFTNSVSNHLLTRRMYTLHTPLAGMDALESLAVAFSLSAKEVPFTTMGSSMTSHDILSDASVVAAEATFFDGLRLFFPMISIQISIWREVWYRRLLFVEVDV